MPLPFSREQFFDVFAAIGPEWELEEWTPQWTRVHRTLAGASLTPAVAEEASEHVVALMRGLDPLLDDLLPRASARGRTPARAR